MPYLEVLIKYCQNRQYMGGFVVVGCDVDVFTGVLAGTKRGRPERSRWHFQIRQVCMGKDGHFRPPNEPRIRHSIRTYQLSFTSC